MSYQSRHRRRHRGHPRRNFLIAFVIALGLAGTGALGALVLWVTATANSAPKLASLKQRDPGQVSEILAADGTRLGFIGGDDLRQPVDSADIPQVMRQATVAIEDQRFFHHSGVDYEGIVRAAVKNVVSHRTVQGGSTLTMQLVRNLYTGDSTRSGIEGYKRKIREAKLALDLERTHDKNWILAKYLNTVPYGTIGGQQATGVRAAARIYFNTSVQNLTLREAAMIAGLPQAPSDYSPILHPAAAKQRRNEVLGKMAELGMITTEQARVNMRKGLGLDRSNYYTRKRERYFFDYVKAELIKEYGRSVVERGGLKVRTTIDLDKQQEARAAIKERMGDAGPSSAIVTIDPKNGDIEAMASSADYSQSKFNLAAQGRRQSGSTFKVMALMTALRFGVNPDSTHYVSRSPTIIDNTPWGKIDVKTYGGKGAGTLSLRQATLKSDNSVYIQLALDVGPDKIKDTARMMGITSPLHGYPSETLGSASVSPLEMANAYATIASGGFRNRPRAITKVTLPDGKSELPKRWRVKRTRVFTDGVTAEATSILEANLKGGTATHAQFGCPAAAKTGTTDHNTDAWLLGFTPRLATAVWVGYPKSTQIQMNGLYFGRNVDGGTFPADIWGTYMKAATGGHCASFPKPKTAFVSKPFHSKYSTSGSKRDDVSGPTTPSAGQDTPGTAPDTGTTGDKRSKGDRTGGSGDGNNGNGGGNGQGDTTRGFNPDDYTSPGGGTQAPGA